MVDIVTPAVRSRMMSAVKGRNTKPELVVRKRLFARGLRYSLHSKSLPGKPDLLFRRYKAVVFIHGCFWHGHRNCKNAKTPATNKKFWIDKIEKNRARDTRCRKELKDKNWKVLTVWECQLKKDKVEQILSSLANKIES